MNSTLLRHPAVCSATAGLLFVLVGKIGLTRIPHKEVCLAAISNNKCGGPFIHLYEHHQMPFSMVTVSLAFFYVTK